jgi:hypothetical protein
MQLLSGQTITNPNTGVTLTYEEWAKRIGIKYRSFRSRVQRHKDPNKLFAPVKPKVEELILTHPDTGETLTYQEWADRLGLTVRGIKSRIRKCSDLRVVLSQNQREILLTHPDTKECLTVRQWAEKLNVKIKTIHDRRNSGLCMKEVLAPRYNRKDRWRREEDALLEEVLFLPNFCKEYQKRAKLWGLEERTEGAIKTRVIILRRQKKLPKVQSNIEGYLKVGIITPPELAKKLNISGSTVTYFLKKNLRYTRAGERTYIKLADFAQWAISPVGSAILSQRIKQDQKAVEWTFTIIGKWLWVDD